MAHELVCSRCAELHPFTVGELERIVYALQGMEVDTRTAEAEKPHPWRAEEWCLREVLDLSRSVEGYGEYVEATHELRLNLQRGRRAAEALGATP